MAWCGANRGTQPMYTSDAAALGTNPRVETQYRKVTGDFNNDGIQDTAYLSQQVVKTGPPALRGQAGGVQYTKVRRDFNNDGIMDTAYISNGRRAGGLGNGFGAGAAAAAGGVAYTKVQGDFNNDGIMDTAYISNAGAAGGLGSGVCGSGGCVAVGNSSKVEYVDVPVTERIKVDRVRRKQVTKLVPECKTVMTRQARTKQEYYMEPVTRTGIRKVPKQIVVTSMKVIKRPKQICAKRIISGSTAVQVPVQMTGTRTKSRVVTYTDYEDQIRQKAVKDVRPCTVRIPKYKAVVTNPGQGLLR